MAEPTEKSLEAQLMESAAEMGLEDSPRDSKPAPAPRAPARAAAAEEEDEEDDDRDELDTEPPARIRQPDDEEEEDDAEEDDDAGADDDADEDAEDDAEEGEEGEETDDDPEEDDDGADVADPAAPELDEEFRALAERHRLPTEFQDALADIPKEHRAKAAAAFGKRLKEIEAGFTRGMQDLRSYREREAEVTARERFAKEKPLDFVLSVMAANPDLSDQLAEEMERLTDDRYARAREIEVRNAEKDAIEAGKKAYRDEQQSAESRAQRLTAVESLFSAEIARHGLAENAEAAELIEEAVAAEITASPNRDISDARLREIVKERAAKLRKAGIVAKQQERKDYLKGKQTAIANRPKVRPGRSAAHPAPAGRRPPKNLEDALTRAAAAVAPDMPA